METFVTIIHIIVSIILIIVVLLQAGKGAEVGAVFGGGASQALFGGSGSGSFLSKLTTWAAILFMVTSTSLAYMESKATTSSVIDDVKIETKTTEFPTPVSGEQAQPSENTDVAQPVTTQAE